MKAPLDTTTSEPLKVWRGRVASVDLYQIKASELDPLERRSPATIQLNFAVFLVSLAFSSIAALCTADLKWLIAQTVFLLIAIVDILLGGYLSVIWRKTGISLRAVAEAIRSRMEVSARTQDLSRNGKGEFDIGG